MMSVRKNCFYILTILLMVSTVEICSAFLVKKMFRQLFLPDFKMRFAEMKEEHIIKIRDNGYYHPKLGWDRGLSSSGKAKINTNGTRIFHTVNRAGSPVTYTYDGDVRKNPYESERKIISTYGDSFTECAEVNDDQTWQYFLSQKTESDVLNFGEQAYGVDQAYLKLELKIKDHWTEMVILCVYSEDIKRNMSMYRPFLEPKGGPIFGFKPMFAKIETNYILIPNPLRNFAGREDLFIALQQAKDKDYWFRLRPEAKSPYTVSILKAIKFRYIDQIKLIHPYEDENQTEILAHIIRKFVDLSKKEQFKPILLFIPSVHEIKTDEYHYRVFLDKIRYDGKMSRLTIVDVMDHKFEKKEFYIKEFEGHASEYGNRIIANAVFSRIKKYMD